MVALVMILNGTYDSTEFMGVDVTTVKGLQVAKETCKGTAHVKVAFFLFILEVIGTVTMIVSFFLGGFNDWIQFLSGISSCALLYFYHTECKELA